MTQSHEGESAIFSDAKGKPVDDPKEAHLIEITSPDGMHTVLAKPGPDGTVTDPFARQPRS